jgi:hypothetical protein
MARVDEALDQDAARVDPGVQQRRLDEIHERAGSADVEVRVEAAGDEPGDRCGVEESGVGVVVVAHLDAVRMAVPQPAQLIAEDH